MTDRATEALAEAKSSGEPVKYSAISRRKNVPRITLYYRDHGRPSREEKAQRQQYLTPSEEKALVKFLERMHELGNGVRIKYLPSLACSIARRRSSTNTAVKPPGKNWAQAFKKRHDEALRSRKMRVMDWKRHDNIYDKVTGWFEVIGKLLEDPDILTENVYNMDETGVMLCKLGSAQVLVSRNDWVNYRGTAENRTMVTAIECISANGRSLLPMVIWPATTHRNNWTTFPTPGWHYACTESGYTNSKVSLEWLKRVFDPQTKDQANGKPRVLISDGFATHETPESLEFCFENNIIPCRLPSHTSHKTQPCDVGVFSPFKTYYRDELGKLLRGGARTVGKEDFIYLYYPAREKAFTKRNITKAWAASGLFPFNPNRVLRGIPKPPAELTVPKADDVEVGPSPQDEVLQTPVTPVSAEAFTSLHNIIKQDALTLDKASIPRLLRHVEKLAKSGQTFFAESTLFKDEYELAVRLNQDSKVRKSAKSFILGKGEGKVMSYEDIEEARAKRAAKAAKKGKRKQSRKRKSAELEADELEPEPEGACAAKAAKKSRAKRRRKHKNAAI